MKTIETVLEVDERGDAVAKHTGLSPGTHRAILMIEENGKPEPADQREEAAKRPSILDWQGASLGAWPDGLSLRREDLYDDDGR